MIKKVSIISPCYNEENVINSFFTSLFEIIDPFIAYEFEIIIVDDGCSDRSLDLLHIQSQNDPRITIVELNRNFGKEIAITAGIDHANGDAAIIMDFDLQHPPELIVDFLENWELGYESVVGIRKNRQTDSLLKRKMAELFYATYNLFSNVKITRNSGDFRLLDRKIINQLKSLPERQRFMKGLFSWIGAKTAYIPYEVQKRIGGKTKFSGWRLWNFAIEGITSFSTIPLRVWTYIGLAISSASFIYGASIIFNTLIFGIQTPGYSSLIVAVLFLGGIQIMGIGIIGEYLGRTYIESKQRPLYLVRKIIKK